MMEPGGSLVLAPEEVALVHHLPLIKHLLSQEARKIHLSQKQKECLSGQESQALVFPLSQ